ncbi:MAG: hypothetical protein NTW02_02300 [Cyanobium sp. LacPavin_0920_WC12_MAG_62_9]|nr:hypothetical protein [Cyanobium sp. LacPavin_0920_WC12_MAG_62_9]
MVIRTTVPGRLGSPALLALILASALGIPQAQAGPLVRRYQERQACQQFAGKLQAVSGNPQQAQYVYQQGVLKLVETFGENPCTDIPVPTATAPTAAPTAAPGVAPVAAPVATPKAVVPATTPVTAAPANPQQQQACQQFAAKLQGASGNPSQAQQIYAMGTQKLTGMFGPNPCPQVSAP